MQKLDRMRACGLGLIAAACAALLACGPRKPAEQAASAAPPCIAQAEAKWAPTETSSLSITGAVDGADCASAQATITIKDAAGKTLYTDNLPASVMSNTIFADATTPEAMGKGLEQWIDPTTASADKSTDDLPVWKANQDVVGETEFPFHPDVSREDFAKLRARKLPMYCHVQGGESLACIAYDEAADTLIKVGVQQFPG